MENRRYKYNIEELAGELELEISDLSGLFKSYLEEMKSEISEVYRFLAQKDWNMLQRTVHNVKGVSANLGVDDVFRQAEEFDLMLKKNITECASEQVEKLAALLNSADLEIKSFFIEKGIRL